MANKQTEPEIVEQPVAELMPEPEKVEEPVKKGKVAQRFQGIPGWGVVEPSDKIYEKPDEVPLETWNNLFKDGLMSEV